MKSKLTIAGVVALAALAIGCGGTSPSDDPINLDTGSTAPALAPSPAPTKAGTVGDGTWDVGTDIKPGTYRSPGAADSAFVFCNWQVKDGEEYQDGGSSDKKADPQQVTVKKGQTFETDGCAVWVARKKP